MSSETLRGSVPTGHHTREGNNGFENVCLQCHTRKISYSRYRSLCFELLFYIIISSILSSHMTQIGEALHNTVMWPRQVKLSTTLNLQLSRSAADAWHLLICCWRLSAEEADSTMASAQLSDKTSICYEASNIPPSKNNIQIVNINKIQAGERVCHWRIPLGEVNTSGEALSLWTTELRWMYQTKRRFREIFLHQIIYSAVWIN